MSIDNPTTPLDRALGAEERANERVCELEDLRDELQAKVTRLEGEATVLRQLLREASNVMTTIVPEDDTEELVLNALQDQIAAAVTPKAPQDDDGIDGKDCTPNHLCKGHFIHLPNGEACDRCGFDGAQL